jgi:site-specific recombinase XerD
LTQQRALSAQTIAAYRNGFMLFLDFAESRLGKSPAAMALADMTPELIMAFLDHLERQRHNSVRSRNARLAALRSFLKFAAHRDVSSLQVIERALGVPVKRFERPMFGYLSREEMLAVIGAPDGTWSGQRDHMLFLLLYNTGARVSEITGSRSEKWCSTMVRLACICMARAASSAACRCGVRPSRQSGPG